jgi:hypothetical protein
VRANAHSRAVLFFGVRALAIERHKLCVIHVGTERALAPGTAGRFIGNGLFFQDRMRSNERGPP